MQLIASNLVRPVVNFTNILRATFCTKVLCAAFWFLHFSFVLFGERIAAQKLL
jgi:hypothetical protein